ncbi:chemotaxis protein CheA [Methylomonas sp. LL1]|uniref:chemotaxis protein CheA n=1 Tax=Methylomonas sp. LL1 TaxID=2785785 RepID=UPI0018C3887B|nr:chemotaxis protein CheA [Methylomonas sp. LL1]QPK62444.1 chemotaxis protein CheA [Methylomonas sp. LL1]
MNFDAEMRDALKTFTVESLELLQDMEDGLLGLEQDPDPAERINAIFRTAHTIKGSAGLFGLDHIVAFTHVVESVLDSLRDGKLSVTSELVAALLPCRDHISVLIGCVADGQTEEDSTLTAAGRQLLDGLQPFLNSRPNSSVTAVAQPDDKVEAVGGGVIEAGNWHLFLQFGENSLRDGMDPLSFIRYLATLGEIVHIATLSHSIPDAENMNPENSYLGFEIILKSDASKETIDRAFDFVRDGSHIHILPLENRIPYYVELIESLTEDNAQLGELLIKSGVITQRELEQGLKTQQTQAETLPENARIGEILVDQQVVQQPLIDAALEKQKQLKDTKARENQSIRVDAERLDKLIDLIGELVISTAAASLRAQQIGDVALQETNAGVISLVEEVRDSALQLRMVPIGTTFSRFQRVVRDVSKELGKDIKLVISGAETEVDKSVVEKIGDPLMHLVRNAMDHGIERAEIRAERGKPVQGTLRLNAYHSSGNIVIEVGDDGGGLDRDKIMAKAVERELIPAGATLSDQEIYALIFEPGFSTADQVSSLSGRGVGMDVVKRNITELRGIIHVDSLPGQGTTLRIHLPLTLAIIDGFLVGVGDTSYVIPLDRVVECVELPVDDNRDYMELRGEVLPFIRLRNLFRKSGGLARRQNVIVVEHLDLKAGLVVDKLMGELQTVIKPLGKLFGHVQGIGGSTILGSGEVALIIDVPTMLRQQEQGSAAG